MLLVYVEKFRCNKMHSAISLGEFRLSSFNPFSSPPERRAYVIATVCLEVVQAVD